MNKDDAATFPFVASFALFSLYAAFKYFNEDVVKSLIFFYLTVVATLAVAGCINIFMENYYPAQLFSFSNEKRIFHSISSISFQVQVGSSSL